MTSQQNALKEFSRIPILSNLTEDEIFDFVRLCKVHRLAEGERLFAQGEPSRSMYIIESGVVDVFLERTDGREHIAEFGALDVLGELSLVDPAPRSATAEARKETVLYEVLGDDFEQMLTQLHPAAFKIVRSLARVVCRRIRTVHERIDAELSGTTPPAPHTGDFDRKVGRKATITSPHETVAVPGKPGSGKNPVTSGVIRRAISKLWGSDE